MITINENVEVHKKYKKKMFRSNSVTQHFYKQVANHKGEKFSREYIVKYLGYDKKTTADEDKKVSVLYDIMNGIGVCMSYDKQGKFVSADIPKEYARMFLVATAGHKKGESNALY